MRLFQSRSRSTRRLVIECLESRQLLAADLFEVPPSLNAASGTNQTIDLSQLVNSRVRFATNQGDIDMELFDGIKSATVDNFLNYVTQGRYNGTIVHRVTSMQNAGIAVIQGGGFMPFFPSTDGPAPQHIATDAPIVNEGRTDGIKSNVAGTIAMARTSDPNSATSEWFINTEDNTVLDPGDDANDPSQAGYAVFGKILTGLDVAQAIQQLPNGPIGDPNVSPLQTTPLLQAPDSNGDPVPGSYITLNASTLPSPALTFSVKSNNPAVATAAIEGNNLVINFGPSVGVTSLVVTGTDAQNNTANHNIVIVTKPTEAPTLTVNLGGEGNPTSVAFVDADGTASTLSLKGAGTAVVKIQGDSLTQATAGKKATVSGAAASIESITAANTNATSAMTLSGSGGNGSVDVSTFISSGAMKSVSMKVANFAGTLNIAAVSKFDLGNTTNSNINLGGNSQFKPMSISLGNAAGTVLKSSTPVKTFTAGSFTAESGPTPPQITLQSVSRFAIAGNLANRVVVAGAIKSMTIGGNMTGVIRADSIGSLIIGGDATDANISLTRAFAPKEKPVGKVTVAGAFTRSLLRAAGNISSVTFGSADGSEIISGLPSSNVGTTLPTSPSDFASPSSINSFTVKGNYAGTNVIASTLGRIKLGTLVTSNGNAPFGAGADRIASITGSLGQGPLTIKKIDTPTDVQEQVGEADLGDFQIAAV